MWKRNFGGDHINRPGRRRSRRVRQVELNGFEQLDRRILLTVTATFADLAGDLRILGDAGDNTIVVSRDAAGTILVNHGDIAIQGGVPTVANTHEIFMNGQAGNDNLSLDETNGPLPGAALFGGDGNDTLIGGSGEDFADGGAGNDTILLGAGDDTFGWNPGDGSDTIDGQGGADTMQFNGSTAAEHIDISASGRHVRFTRDLGGVAMDLVGVETINFSAAGDGDTINVDDQSSTDLVAVNLDLERVAGTNDGLPDSVVVNGTEGADTVQVQPTDGTSVTVTGLFPVVNLTGEATSDNLTVNALGGDDLVDASALPANLIGLVLNGGAGSDLLIGSQGPDLVIGGPGDDSADLGDGDDTFVWNPGDGSDDVLGQGDSDRLVFNGSGNSENFGISANGNQARLTRDVGGVTMDLVGIETVDINALGGADTVTVNDLTGTDVTAVDVNLAGSAGGGDGQIDSVVVNGTERDDTVQILSTLDGSRITAAGLQATVKITGAEATSDILTVNALGGDDVVDASLLASNLIGLALNGGNGNNTILRDTSTFSIVSSLPTSTFGQAVSFTATVNPPNGGPSPTGTVQFVVDGTNFGGPVPLVGGSATSAPLGNLGAGSHTILARYSGDGNYAANTDHLTQAVNKATPTITWANPADITFGTALGSAQLDAAASIPGTFAYSPAAGTILEAGQHRTLTATFTPNDTTDYNTVTTTASINVLNVAPPAPAPHATGIVSVSHTRKGLVSITAAFDEALNPKFLNSLSLFSVLGGVRKHGKTIFSKSVLVNGFHYDDTAHTVTITLARPFKGTVKATIRPGVVAANGASSGAEFTAFVK